MSILDDEVTNEDVRGVKVITLIGPDLLKRLAVIPEQYDKKNYGRVKRAFLEQFNEHERKVLSTWYPRLYSWEYKKGYPYDGVRMAVGTYVKLVRFANFFATI